jgi:hypothetical protein
MNIDKLIEEYKDNPFAIRWIIKNYLKQWNIQM